MANCLIAFGSNQGDREATLDSALATLDATAGVHLHRASEWHAFPPVGVAGSRHEFLNGAALLETTREPAELLAILQHVELDHGRQQQQPWSDRTLDLDLLLYERQVIDTLALTVPHPRMSYRRFVLEPAAEIAGPLIHPTIGWTLGQLLRHLDAGANCVAILSRSDSDRNELAAMLVDRFSATAINSLPKLDVARRWPESLTTWMSIPLSPAATSSVQVVPPATTNPSAYPAANLPKLTIILETDSPALAATSGGEADWNTVVRHTGRGPTLRIAVASPEIVRQEVSAAVESVWPHLGQLASDRLK